jgi:hypothetical protein
MNLRCGWILATLMLAALTLCAGGQFSTEIPANAPQTKTTEQPLQSSTAVREIDLLDDLHLTPIGQHYCGDKYHTDGSACGSDKYGRRCCEKGEVCLVGKETEDSTGTGYYCCAQGYKWCPGPHGTLNGGCWEQSKPCPTRSPGTVR